MNKTTPASDDSNKPPLFKSWNTLYAIVIGQLVLAILLFYLITSFFS